MRTQRSLPIEVHRAYCHAALGRFAGFFGLLSAVSWLALRLASNVDDWAARFLAAFWLVQAGSELREFRRVRARLDNSGITYADGWLTSRVGFADVLAWERDAKGNGVVLTTRDGRSRLVYLGQVAQVDREEVIAHLTTRLGPAAIRKRWSRSGVAWRHGLRDLAWLTVSLLAVMQVVDAASAWRAPRLVSPSMTLASAFAAHPPYGPRPEFYALPPAPYVELPLVFDGGYHGPWRFSHCHIEALGGMCGALDARASTS